MGVFLEITVEEVGQQTAYWTRSFPYRYGVPAVGDSVALVEAGWEETVRNRLWQHNGDVLVQFRRVRVIPLDTESWTVDEHVNLWVVGNEDGVHPHDLLEADESWVRQ